MCKSYELMKSQVSNFVRTAEISWRWKTFGFSPLFAVPLIFLLSFLFTDFMCEWVCVSSFFFHFQFCCHLDSCSHYFFFIFTHNSSNKKEGKKLKRVSLSSLMAVDFGKLIDSCPFLLYYLFETKTIKTKHLLPPIVSVLSEFIPFYRAR